MKKKKRWKRASRKPARKDSTGPKTFDEYFAGIPLQARVTFGKLRDIVRSAVPAESSEAISYGIPAYKRNGVLVWFGAFSDHCSLFPTAVVIDKFQKELKGYSVSKGTIHFPLDKPLPLSLIKNIVKASANRNETKKKRK